MKETRKSRSWRLSLWPLVSVLTLLVVGFIWWYLTTGTGLVRSLYFPSPEEVLSRIAVLKLNILYSAFATMTRVVVSWLIGSMLGVLVGLIMVRSPLFYYISVPLIESLRPVPPVALIPFIILWFGIGESGKIFLSSLGCFMVMVINTLVASRNVPIVYLRAARSLGASENQVYSTVVLPSIVPYLVSGLRVGIALSFALTVAAEFMGAESGIGALIMLASRTLNTDVVLLGTIIIGIEAFVLERVVRYLTDVITSWSEHSGEEKT